MNNEGNTNNIFGVDMGGQSVKSDNSANGVPSQQGINNQGLNIPSMNSLNNFRPLQGVNDINSRIPFEQPIDNSVNTPLPGNTPLPRGNDNNIPINSKDNGNSVIPNLDGNGVVMGEKITPDIPMQSIGDLNNTSMSNGVNDVSSESNNVNLQSSVQFNNSVDNGIKQANVNMQMNSMPNIPMDSTNLSVDNNQKDNVNSFNSVNNQNVNPLPDGMIPLNLNSQDVMTSANVSSINQVNEDNNKFELNNSKKRKSKGFIVYLIICGIVIVLGLVAYFTIKLIKNRNSDSYVEENNQSDVQLVCSISDNNMSEEYYFEFSEDSKKLVSVYLNKSISFDGDGSDTLNLLNGEKDSLTNDGIIADISEGVNEYYLTYSVIADDFKKANPNYNLNSLDDVKNQYNSLGYTCE